jgi:ABC-type nitrate/sulfonate/bicarbonate transport system permease component
MAESGRLRKPVTLGPLSLSPVTTLRIAIIVGVLATWQLVSVSGLLFRDVVPSLPLIAGSLITTVLDGSFYYHLGWTVYEIAVGLAVGGSCGLAVGVLLGGSPFLSSAYERFLYYLGPTPKVIFFPVMIMWFGVGPCSKMAMASLSCFFPIALSTAAGMRQIDKVLIRVGRSFRLSTAQMVTKVYLPAMRAPVLSGMRLGLGVALIGTLLAETRLANRGIGYIIIQSYNTFDMPYMYALLILLFVLAIGLNVVIGRFAESDRISL